MGNKWEKTVLVAGIRNNNANFMERLRKMFLRVSHQLDETGQGEPFARDCAIIATDNISHEHWHKVKNF